MRPLLQEPGSQRVSGSAHGSGRAGEKLSAVACASHLAVHFTGRTLHTPRPRPLSSYRPRAATQSRSRSGPRSGRRRFRPSGAQPEERRAIGARGAARDGLGAHSRRCTRRSNSPARGVRRPSPPRYREAERALCPRARPGLCPEEAAAPSPRLRLCPRAGRAGRGGGSQAEGEGGGGGGLRRREEGSRGGGSAGCRAGGAAGSREDADDEQAVHREPEPRRHRRRPPAALRGQEAAPGGTGPAQVRLRLRGLPRPELGHPRHRDPLGWALARPTPRLAGSGRWQWGGRAPRAAPAATPAPARTLPRTSSARLWWRAGSGTAGCPAPTAGATLDPSRVPRASDSGRPCVPPGVPGLAGFLEAPLACPAAPRSFPRPHLCRAPFSFSLTLLVPSLPGAPQVQHLPFWPDLPSFHASCQRPLALCSLPSCTLLFEIPPPVSWPPTFGSSSTLPTEPFEVPGFPLPGPCRTAHLPRSFPEAHFPLAGLGSAPIFPWIFCPILLRRTRGWGLSASRLPASCSARSTFLRGTLSQLGGGPGWEPGKRRPGGPRARWSPDGSRSATLACARVPSSHPAPARDGPRSPGLRPPTPQGPPSLETCAAGWAGETWGSPQSRRPQSWGLLRVSPVPRWQGGRWGGGGGRAPRNLGVLGWRNMELGAGEAGARQPCSLSFKWAHLFKLAPLFIKCVFPVMPPTAIPGVGTGLVPFPPRPPPVAPTFHHSWR